MDTIETQIEKLQKGIENPFVSQPMKEKMKEALKQLEMRNINVAVPAQKPETTVLDLENRLKILNLMVKKNPKVKPRIKIVEMMLKKAKDAEKTSSKTKKTSQKSGKVKVKDIEILWSEGDQSKFDKFPKKYKTWKAANEAIKPIALDIKEYDGYNKVKFIVTFEDGETYEGRLDVTYDRYDSPFKSDNVVGNHIKEFLNYELDGEHSQATEETKKEIEEWLDNYDLGVAELKRVNKVSAKELMDKMINLVKGKVDPDYAHKTKYITEEDVEKFMSYGVYDELIIAFYCGVEIAFDWQGELDYGGVQGIFSYTDDYIQRSIDTALKNCRAGKFELGFKYPHFDWSEILKGTPEEQIIEGKEREIPSTKQKYVSVFKILKYPNIVVGGDIGVREDMGGGIAWEDKTNPNQNVLESSYIGMVSSNPKAILDVLKACAKQKSGGAKDIDVLVNGLGGIGYRELDINKIKYAEGGEVDSFSHPNSVKMRKILSEKLKKDIQSINVRDNEVVITLNHKPYDVDYVKTPILNKVKKELEKEKLSHYKIIILTPYSKGGSTYSNGGEIKEYENKAFSLGEPVLINIGQQKGKGVGSFWVSANISNTHPNRITVERDAPYGGEKIEHDVPNKYLTSDYIVKEQDADKFAKGGETDSRMFNFLKDDLKELEAAINNGDTEKTEQLFSYWNQHLPSLKTKTNNRMYNFLKDDFKGLEEAVRKGDNEEIERFFSYWNQHLGSLKMADGGSTYSNGGEIYSTLSFETKKEAEQNAKNIENYFNERFVGSEVILGTDERGKKGYQVKYELKKDGGSTYAGGGEVWLLKGVGNSGLNKIKELSKENPNKLYLVTDDNYSNIGNFWLQNGKFAKMTVANHNYDFANNKVYLRAKSDIIYKVKELGKFAKGGETDVRDEGNIAKTYDGRKGKIKKVDGLYYTLKFKDGKLPHTQIFHQRDLIFSDSKHFAKGGEINHTYEVVRGADDSIVMSDGHDRRKWDFAGNKVAPPNNIEFDRLKSILTYDTIEAPSFQEAYEKAKKKYSNTFAKGGQTFKGYGVEIRRDKDSYWEQYDENLTKEEADELAEELKSSGKYHQVVSQVPLPFADGGEIKTTYEDFDNDYDAFTDYVVDRISLEERREIRKDWNKQYDTGEKDWHKYLLMRVNEKKSNNDGGEVRKVENRLIYQYSNNKQETIGFINNSTKDLNLSPFASKELQQKGEEWANKNGFKARRTYGDGGEVNPKIRFTENDYNKLINDAPSYPYYSVKDGKYHTIRDDKTEEGVAWFYPTDEKLVINVNADGFDKLEAWLTENSYQTHYEEGGETEYSLEKYFNDYDVNTQANPYGKSGGIYYVVIEDESNPSNTIKNKVWAEGEDELRNDISHYLSDSQYIEKISFQGKYEDGGQTKPKNQRFGVFLAGNIIGEVAYAEDIHDLINNKMLKKWNNWEFIKYKDDEGKTIVVTRYFIDDDGMSVQEVVDDYYATASPEDLEEDIMVLDPKNRQVTGQPKEIKGWLLHKDGGQLDFPEPIKGETWLDRNIKTMDDKRLNIELENQKRIRDEKLYSAVNTPKINEYLINLVKEEIELRNRKN